jgi:hypothetical protein
MILYLSMTFLMRLKAQSISSRRMVSGGAMRMTLSCVSWHRIPSFLSSSQYGRASVFSSIPIHRPLPHLFELRALQRLEPPEEIGSELCGVLRQLLLDFQARRPWQQDAVPAANLECFPQKTGGRNDDAGLALNGLSGPVALGARPLAAAHA